MPWLWSEAQGTKGSDPSSGLSKELRLSALMKDIAEPNNIQPRWEINTGEEKPRWTREWTSDTVYTVSFVKANGEGYTDFFYVGVIGN